MTLEIFGIQLNVWGMYCAIGALCAFAAIAIICAWRGMKKGSASVLGLCSVVLGIICSRFLYCLVESLTKVRMPFSAWINVSEGGWSLFGMIGGVLLAALISAKIMREKTPRMLDAVSIGLPLFIAAERMGEESLQRFFNETEEVFNLSRKVNSGGFLTVVNSGNNYLATYRIDAVLAMVLFLVLAFSLLKKNRRDGDLAILFFLLCGSGGVLAESLRYDHFLEYSFVRIQQVLAALLLLAGVIAAGSQSRKKYREYYTAMILTMVFTVAECIGYEFVLDRSEAVHSTVYFMLICALSIPVIQGITMVNAGNDGRMEIVRGRLSASGGASLSISAAVVLSVTLEMGRIHYNDQFMIMAVGSAVAVLLIQSYTSIRMKTIIGPQENSGKENRDS